MRIPKYLGSSVNPEKISLTIKATAATLIPVIVMIAAGLKITLSPADLTSFADTIAGMVTLSIALYGLGRKIFIAIKNRAN